MVRISCLLTAALFFCALVRNETQSFVNLADYPVAEDTGLLTDKQLEVFHSILDGAENDSETVPVPPMTKQERREIICHLGLHFGSMEGISGLVSWGEGTAALNLDLFRQFAKEKSVIDARVDEAVAALHEGSDRYKLWQICRYLADRIDYTEGVRDTVDGLNGQGVCVTYAMLFYKMATRLGIQTYICYGYTENAYHAWNMVELNGVQYFYDPTWFDNLVSDLRFAHSRTPWGREYILNRS